MVTYNDADNSNRLIADGLTTKFQFVAQSESPTEVVVMVDLKHDAVAALVGQLTSWLSRNPE